MNNKLNGKLLNMVDKLSIKTQINDKDYLYFALNYHLSKLASNLQIRIADLSLDSIIPINNFSIAIAPSGIGKTKYNNYLEDYVFGGFLDRVKKVLLPQCRNAALNEADDREDMMSKIKSKGSYITSFSEATTPAVHQMRELIYLNKIGAISFEVDEIGDNLLRSNEVLKMCLELFDTGKIKPKLIKSTKDYPREEEFREPIPSNFLGYGVEDSLFDCGLTQDSFFKLLDSGLARRTLFYYSDKFHKFEYISKEQLIEVNRYFETLRDAITAKATIENVRQTISMSEDAIEAYRIYQNNCVYKSQEFRQVDRLLKIEMINSKLKVLKLAGTYCFFGLNENINKFEISEQDIINAVESVTLSSEALKKILYNSEKFNRVTKMIETSKDSIISINDINKLFPKLGISKTKKGKEEFVETLISINEEDGKLVKLLKKGKVEYLKSLCFQKSNVLDPDSKNIIISYKENDKNFGEGFRNTKINMEELKSLCVGDKQYCWIPRHCRSGLRNKTTIMNQFNLIMLDIDRNNYRLEHIKSLIEHYYYAIHTTRSYTNEDKRYRIIFPLSHNYELNHKEYKIMMTNLIKEMPLEIDAKTCIDPVRFWFNNPNPSRIWVDNFKQKNKKLFNPNYLIKEKYMSVKEEVQQNYNIEPEKMEAYIISQIRQQGGYRITNLTRYAGMLVKRGQSVEEVKKALNNANDLLGKVSGSHGGSAEQYRIDSIVSSVQKWCSERDTKKGN